MTYSTETNTEVRKGSKVRAYLTLMRPANLVTAIADIAAGFAVGYTLSAGNNIWAGFVPHLSDFLWLCLATIGLYGGGVVFNDVFDYELDKEERPERPLPSGRVSKQQATLLGSVLLLIGIAASFFVGIISGEIALAVALLALLYDAKSKHHVFWGPVNMSLCRAGNLMLGISVFTETLSSAWMLAVFPLLYIGSITLISQGEVGGGNKRHLRLAIVGYTLVFAMLIALKLVYPVNIVRMLPFLGLFGIMVFPPLFKAYKQPDAVHIRAAVKAGVISLILLNASIAAGFAGPIYGLAVLLLLPISLLLGKMFSVT